MGDLAPVRAKVKWTEEHARGSFEDMTDTYSYEACEGFVVGHPCPDQLYVYVTQGLMLGTVVYKDMMDVELDTTDPVTAFIVAARV